MAGISGIMERKKLIEVPGYIYSLPPEPFIVSRNGSSKGKKLPSRGSVGSKRSFRNRMFRGTIETVFSAPQNPWTSFEQASEVHPDCKIAK